MEEISLSGPVVNFTPGGKLPEPTLATLRVSSGEERFVVSVARGWRELSNDPPWEKLARARESLDCTRS